MPQAFRAAVAAARRDLKKNGRRPANLIRVVPDTSVPVSAVTSTLGHRNIQRAVKYSATVPARFEKLWRLA